MSDTVHPCQATEFAPHITLQILSWRHFSQVLVRLNASYICIAHRVGRKSPIMNVKVSVSCIGLSALTLAVQWACERDSKLPPFSWTLLSTVPHCCDSIPTLSFLPMEHALLRSSARVYGRRHCSCGCTTSKRGLSASGSPKTWTEQLAGGGFCHPYWALPFYRVKRRIGDCK